MISSYSMALSHSPHQAVANSPFPFAHVSRMVFGYSVPNQYVLVKRPLAISSVEISDHKTILSTQNYSVHKNLMWRERVLSKKTSASDRNYFAKLSTAYHREGKRDAELQQISSICTVKLSLFTTFASSLLQGARMFSRPLFSYLGSLLQY